MSAPAEQKDPSTMQLEVRDEDWSGGDKPDGTAMQTDDRGFTTDTSQLPKGYFYSANFLGTFAAMGLGFWAGQSHPPGLPSP